MSKTQKNPTNHQEKSRNRKHFRRFFRKYSAPSLNSVEQINHQNNVEAQAHGELIQYKMFNCIEEDDDPLVWWRLHQDQFPLLTPIAKKLLSITGTSVPSERVFSSAGDVVSATRSLLKA